jgi:hypothetical protein
MLLDFGTNESAHSRKEPYDRSRKCADVGAWARNRNEPPENAIANIKKIRYVIEAQA